ncbi:unnamed protein product [Amoebophrya sp. A25]|nr:unnamed protein product [Amoebophrya sp. A25]|eukprot:GSA25T00000102001.1
MASSTSGTGLSHPSTARCGFDFVEALPTEYTRSVELVCMSAVVIRSQDGTKVMKTLPPLPAELMHLKRIRKRETPTELKGAKPASGEHATESNGNGDQQSPDSSKGSPDSKDGDQSAKAKAKKAGGAGLLEVLVGPIASSSSSSSTRATREGRATSKSDDSSIVGCRDRASVAQSGAGVSLSHQQQDTSGTPASSSSFQGLADNYSTSDANKPATTSNFDAVVSALPPDAVVERIEVEVPAHAPLTMAQVDTWGKHWPLTYRRPPFSPEGFSEEQISRFRTVTSWLTEDASLQCVVLLPERDKNDLRLKHALFGGDGRADHECSDGVTRTVVEDELGKKDEAISVPPAKRQKITAKNGAKTDGASSGHAGKATSFDVGSNVKVGSASLCPSRSATRIEDAFQVFKIHDERNPREGSVQGGRKGATASMSTPAAPSSFSARVACGASATSCSALAPQHPLRSHAVMRACEAVGKSLAGLARNARGEEQYLCLGAEVYTRVEPCVMCAMALVHSRVRLVCFERPDASFGGFGGRLRLHEEKSLNHQVRVVRRIARPA